MINDDKVQLDLNVPAFQKKLFALDAGEVKKAFKTFQKLQALNWHEVFRDHGLKWEQVKNEPGTFTIRLSRSYRAVVEREGRLCCFKRSTLTTTVPTGKNRNGTGTAC